MKFYEYIKKRLKSLNVSRCFGVPGSYIMPIWDNMNEIEVTVCTNEQDASYIASCYAYSSNTLGVLLTTASPGIINALSGICTSFKDNTPLLIISGVQNNNATYKGAFQEESKSVFNYQTTDLTKYVTKFCYKITKPEEAVKIFEKALKTALTKPCGPVHLSIPLEIQICEVSHEINECMENKKEEKYVIPNIITKKPLIIVGNGCVLENAIDKVYQFAEKIDAPILSTMKGYSAIDYNNPYFLEKLGSTTTNNLINFIKDYKPENIFVFGSSLGLKDIIKIKDYIKDANFIIVDVNKKYNCEFKFAQFYYKSINDSIDIFLENMKRSRTNNKNKIIEFKNKLCSFYENKINDNLVASCINLLNNLSDEFIVTTDAGNHYLETLSIYKNKGFKKFYANAGQAAMGIGICSSIGFAFDNKKVISITGDGCMLMNGNSIYLAKKYNLDICFIVFNNSSLGRVRVGQMKNNKFIASDLSNIDFISFAKTYSIKTKKVNNINGFKKVLKRFANKKGPSLIEVIVDKNEIPLILKEN